MLVPTVQNNPNNAQASSHREYARFFLLNPTPVASWITRNKSTRYLVWFLLLVWLLFSSLIGAFSYQVGQVYIHRHNGTSLFNHMKTAVKILNKMSEDKYHCFHCISNHTTSEIILKLNQTSDDLFQQQIQMKRMRFVLYLFSMFNIVHFSVVFPGPLILNILSLTNIIFLFLGLYVDQFDVVICVESVAVLLSVVSCLYIFYRVMTAMYDTPQRQSDKDD